LDACARLLALSDLGIDLAEGRRRAEAAVADGSAAAVWGRWLAAQGAVAGAALPEAPVVRDVAAPVDAHVVALGAIAVGNAALHLGAGRRTKDDEIDHAVGVVCLAKRGDAVTQGQTIAQVHARDDSNAEEGARDVLAAYSFGTEAPAPRDVLLDVITG
ncbi:MAG TPA: hypothetical protein VGU02_10000, partial [Gaiellaceae bacterium]|nr:hypothetical protein [Gaiellaceae bacterium]